MYSIFVQIASYRDPELIPTLHSLINNAKYPEQLTICVAHQHSSKDKWDTLEEFKDDSRFIIIDIPYEESLGTCWARNQIQQHYTKEFFTLQLDSHHRFVKNWDDKCIKMFFRLRKKGIKRPLITSYLPSYDPNNDPKHRSKVPWGMSFDRFSPDGMALFIPYHLKKNTKQPIPARFYSGHFAFTIGGFCREVPHDPLLYFHGEEISIAVRATSWGYEMFHPNTIIAWHEYTREGRAKHWDDNVQWDKMDQASKTRVRNLLQIDNQKCSPCAKRALKGYDLGPISSLSWYQMFAGINFKERSVQQSTLDNKPPGVRSEVYHKLVRHKVMLSPKSLMENDYSFVAVIYQDENNKEIHRNDLLPKQIKHWKGVKEIIIDTEYIGKYPKKYIVWPYSKSKGWVNQIEGEVK
tara:strand:- start:2015 stop:3238 length:1224 start_codon:yes stop_codon:yes gene_type:complete